MQSSCLTPVASLDNGWQVSEVQAKRGRRRAVRIQKIVAISGVGVRQYWRELGYKLRDTYMIKKI